MSQSNKSAKKSVDVKSGSKASGHNKMFSFSNNQHSDNDILGSKFKTFHVNDNGISNSKSNSKHYRDLSQEIIDQRRMNKTSNGGGLSQHLDQISRLE
jgi:hypothetical protein